LSHASYSYGFREKEKCHQNVKRIKVKLYTNTVTTILFLLYIGIDNFLVKLNTNLLDYKGLKSYKRLNQN